jgi:hypothetical protein
LAERCNRQLLIEAGQLIRDEPTQGVAGVGS